MGESMLWNCPKDLDAKMFKSAGGSVAP